MAQVAYITRVSIPNKVAQAAQITSMCKAFNDLIGDEFVLVSPTKEINSLDHLTFSRKIINLKTKHKILRNILFSSKVFLFLRKNKVEHIYTRDILIAFMTLTFFKIPTCYEAHQPMRNRTSKLLQKIISKNKLYRLITITQSLKKYYENKISFTNKINVVPNGVYFSDYQNEKSKKTLRKELNLPADVFVIAHTGSLFENRGFEKFEVILKNFPKVKLIQIGGKPNDVKKIKLQLIKYDNIEFIDYVPKNIVVKYQLAADALLYLTTENSPIYWCTSPNKIFEYMATKNPILAPNIGSISEILNETNSFVFDLKNDDDLISKIRILIDDENQTITENAFIEVEKKYSMEARVKKISRIMTNK